MNPVAIGAKKAQVAFVDFPVLKPVKPVPGALSFFEFFISINVVNVKNSMVVNSALNAFTTKCSNKSKFLLPIFGVFVGCKAVFVPVVSPTCIAAKPVLTFFPAIFAWLFCSPSVSKIAGSAAKLSSTVFKTVSMYLKFFRAMLTALCDLSFFSHINLHSTYAYYKPKYFKIACERIEQAVAQGQLFEPERAKQIQGALV